MIGIDLVEIGRFAEIASEGFLNGFVFTEKEREFCKNSLPCYAQMFAIKEATIKACRYSKTYSGLRVWNLKVEHTDAGYELYFEEFGDLHKIDAIVTVTNTTNLIIAVVILPDELCRYNQ